MGYFFKSRIDYSRILTLPIITGLIVVLISKGSNIGYSILTTSCYYVILLALQKVLVLDEKVLEIIYVYNPFNRGVKIDYKQLQKVVYVDRSNAIRGSNNPHSYARLIKSDETSKTVRIKLSNQEVISVRKILREKEIDFSSVTEEKEQFRRTPI